MTLFLLRHLKYCINRITAEKERQNQQSSEIQREYLTSPPTDATCPCPRAPQGVTAGAALPVLPHEGTDLVSAPDSRAASSHVGTSNGAHGYRSWQHQPLGAA